MPSRFSRFFASLEEDTSDLNHLPLYHICSGKTFSDIKESDTLKANYCSTFEEDLSYFFYGKPNYKIDEKAKDNALLRNAYFPVCIAFDLNSIEKIKRCYPFDSGVFKKHEKAKDKIDGTLDAHSDFALRADPTTVKKLIKYYYGSNEDYVSDSPKEIKLKQIESEHPEQYAVQNYLLILQDSSLKIDRRIKSIEFQIEEEINLKEIEPILIVVPNGHTNDPKEKYPNVKVLRYDVELGSSIDPWEYYKDIRSLIKDYLIEIGTITKAN